MAWAMSTPEEKEWVRGVAFALGQVAHPSIGGEPGLAAEIAHGANLTVLDFEEAGAEQADLDDFREKLDRLCARAARQPAPPRRRVLRKATKSARQTTATRAGHHVR